MLTSDNFQRSLFKFLFISQFSSSFCTPFRGSRVRFERDSHAFMKWLGFLKFSCQLQLVFKNSFIPCRAILSLCWKSLFQHPLRLSCHIFALGVERSAFSVSWLQLVSGILLVLEFLPRSSGFTLDRGLTLLVHNLDSTLILPKVSLLGFVCTTFQGSTVSFQQDSDAFIQWLGFLKFFCQLQLVFKSSFHWETQRH